MKKFICAYGGGYYSMGQGVKSLWWACGKGFSSIFSDTLDFWGFIVYTLSRGEKK